MQIIDTNAQDLAAHLKSFGTGLDGLVRITCEDFEIDGNVTEISEDDGTITVSGLYAAHGPDDEPYLATFHVTYDPVECEEEGEHILTLSCDVRTSCPDNPWTGSGPYYPATIELRS